MTTKQTDSTLTHHHAHRVCPARGFTLVELMIALVIMALIGAISLPLYTEHVDSTRRSDGKSALMQMSAAMHRFKTENDTFVGTVDAGGSPIASFFPDEAPFDGRTALYDLTAAVTATTFTLTATPKATGTLAGDGAMTLTHTGVKTWNGNAGWDD